MLYSKSIINTLKESPSTSNIGSYSLMVRASLMKKMGSTYYSLLPLGKRVFNKILLLINKQLEDNGILEVSNGYNNDTLLYSMVKEYIHKSTDLPIILSSNKEINKNKNIKSGYGLIYNSVTNIKRIESISKDSLQAREIFNKIVMTLKEIFVELNIKIQPIQTGEDKAEILTFLESGDREYFLCDSCGYASSFDYIIPYFYKPLIESQKQLEKVYTPNVKSIEELSSFFNLPKDHFIKTLFFDADGKKILTISRGDRRISEEKLKEVLNANKIEQEDLRYVEKVLALPIGFIGPINLQHIYIVADYSIKGMKDSITGANEIDYHFINVNVGRDFNVDIIADITDTMGGDLCPICRQGKLFKGNGISLVELNIDKEANNIEFMNENEKQNAILSFFNIDINRILATIVEQNRDELGIVWPKSVSPYDVLVIIVQNNELNIEKAMEFERLLQPKDVLIDDRDKTMGIKFNDSELLGIPYIIIVSKKSIENNLYELRTRNNLKTNKMSLENIVEFINNGRIL
jgi:prolyl-tRNA synthetase